MAVGLVVVPAVNPVPTLTQIAPSSGAQGDGDTVVALTGTGFVPTSEVEWDGTAIATTFTSATSLAATLPAADLLVSGTHEVTVYNPSPGGGTSAQVPFAVSVATLNPVPTIASVTPPSLSTTTIDTQITLAGASFIASSSATLDGVTLATSFSSSTELLAIVPAAYLSSPETLAIGVTNPAPGGGPSPTTVSVQVGVANPVPVVSES